MGLPKQEHAIYNLRIPSTGKTVKFRGFTVKEEKILALAQQTKDDETIINAIKNVITACIEGKLDVNSLALFDIEYIITQIRAKSVGEVIQLLMPCKTDPTHEKTPVAIDISKIEVKFPPGHNKKIPLFGNVGVVMRYPTIGELTKFEEADGLSAVLMCIDYIYTDTEMMYAKDQTHEELIEFLEGLSKNQFNKIENDFFKTMPTYNYEFEYTCAACGTVHKKVIKGLSNFFI